VTTEIPVVRSHSPVVLPNSESFAVAEGGSEGTG